jgi:HEAT repeat protein
MTADDVERALAELGHPRKAVQRPAAERLADAARADARVRAQLVDELSSTDARRRWGAAYALARLDPAPAEATPALLEALGAHDGDVRWASARIVTEAARRMPGIADELCALVRAPSSLQRKMALYCLRDLGGGADRALIATALVDGDAAVRLAAMSAAAALLPRTADTADLVATLLADGDAGVRRAAAATLGRLGVRSDAVARALDAAVASEDATLARVAGDALSRLGASGR